MPRPDRPSAPPWLDYILYALLAIAVGGCCCCRANGETRKDSPVLVLSLFPGIGLLDRAFEEEGFCVVRGPDVLWGGDVRKFHPPAGKFDGVIGGPPCQAFSSLARPTLATGKTPKFGNLIPEFERCVVEAESAWFIMENVPAAPVPVVEGYDVYSYILNNRQCPDDNGKPATQNRVRRISWGWRGPGQRPPLLIDVCVFENQKFERAAIRCLSSHNRAADRKRGIKSTEDSLAEQIRKQGLPEDFALPAFHYKAAQQAVVNGVPLPMGRAIARAVKEAAHAS